MTSLLFSSSSTSSSYTVAIDIFVDVSIVAIAVWYFVNNLLLHRNPMYLFWDGGDVLTHVACSETHIE